MYIAWGNIPVNAWNEAERQLGSVAKRELIKSLNHMRSDPKLYFIIAKDLKMKKKWAENIINTASCLCCILHMSM
jgi:hypothetical protein